MLDPKKQLSITLAEPAVFLHTPDPSGRLRPDQNEAPTLVRGILTLNVAKPIGISSIEVELSGVLGISYPEPIGPRHVEPAEKQKIHSSTVTVFRADQAPRAKYSASVGPGLSPVGSGYGEHAGTSISRLPSLPRGRSERRNIISVPPDFGPTPPYTPSVSQPPGQIQPRIVSGGDPAQTLEELRQTLRVNLEGQTSFYEQLRSPSSSSISSPHTNPSIHSNPSSTSNDFPHPEHDTHADCLTHTNPPLEGDTSPHNTEEPSHVLPHRAPLLNHPFRPHSPESTLGIYPSTRSSSRDPSITRTSHSRLRISITSVLDAVKEITSRAPSRSQSVARSEERERGRTRVRVIPEEQRATNIPEIGEGVPCPGNGNHWGPGSDAEHYLHGLGRVLGLERDHEKDGEHKCKEHGENWREFKPGTYSYPISFLLPPELPPTFSVPNASLSYVIKGVVHRPGAFTPKLSCQVPLLVVAAPSIETGEGAGAGDPGPLFVEKQWQGKLAYSFGLSSRLFLLGSERRLGAAASEGADAGAESLEEAAVEARAEAAYGTAMLDLMLLPIEKVKIWRLDLFVDERIRYIDEQGKSFKDDDRRQMRLLEVQDTCSTEEMDSIDEGGQAHKAKHKHKHDCSIPLLPTPISPHRSPLLQYLPPSVDSSTLAGPGPYKLSTIIGLPGCSGRVGGLLHFTVKQKSSNVKVEHNLRLVMRVESVGAEDSHEDGEKKKKMFDIAVQTPITVLSCRCTPACQTLPRYSRITEDSARNGIACPCQPGIMTTDQGHAHEQLGYGHVLTPTSMFSFDSENGAIEEHRGGRERSRSPSRARGGAPSHLYPLTVSIHPRSPSLRSPSASVTQAHSRSNSHARRQFHHAHAPSQTYSEPPLSSSTHEASRPPSPLARYERLVSGLESEAGEAPPSYESVASGA